MVVLEGGGMLSSSGNQYLQPDYLSPLPTTLDAKKSPLALLAQTCSQIGADSPTSKSLISPLDSSSSASKSRAKSHSPPMLHGKDNKSSDKAKRGRNTPPGPPEKLVFKPYENVVSNKKSSAGDDNSSSSSSSSSTPHSNRPGSSKSSSDRSSTPKKDERKSVSPSNSSVENNNNNNGGGGGGKSTPEKPSTPRGASPIIRSGLEILQGHPKDTPLGTYSKHLAAAGLSPLGALCCPPGLEHHQNPAFRPPFPGAPFSHHHAAMLAAGYPGGGNTTAPGPYLSYARVKTPSGGEALVPVCKDPYCTSCQFSMHNQQLFGSTAGAVCPSGCTQCDHQKYNLAMAMSLVPPGPPSSLAYPQLGRPYVCNWIAGDAYCGKRFVTSEELLQHLRTHTSGSDGSVAVTSASQLLSPHSLFSSAGLHHRPGYPNPPLSPLSAARYHPYGKPTLGASPYSAFNPTALGAYYSPYSVYGQRLGAAAAHP